MKKKIALVLKVLLITTLLINEAVAQIPTSGLHGLYNFSSGSLEDATANDNDFTQTGTSLISVNDRFGTATSAIGLSGDHLTRTNIDYPNSGQDIDLGTISFWIRTSTNDSEIRTILDDTNGRSDATSDNTWAGYYFYLRDGKVGISARVQYSASNIGYQGIGVLSNDVISTGDWRHVSATIKGNVRFTGASDIVSASLAFYVDGELQGTSSVTKVASFAGGGLRFLQSMDQNGNITVGNNRDNNLPTENRYQDEIDEIVLHTRQLTATEITQMATTGGYCFADIVDLTIASAQETTIDATLPTDATYDIAFHKESEAFGAATILLDIADGTESLVGLSSSTFYQVYIREHCSSSLKSPWSAFVRVRTSGPIFVDADAAGLNNGSSWTDAYTDVQSALSDAVENSTIWIAEGSYNPGSVRTDKFDFDQNNLRVYGGFNGTETTTAERDLTTSFTILSADVNGDDIGVDFTGNNRTENNYHVARISANNVLLDGLQFNDGQANGSGDDRSGAGIQLLDKVQGTQALNPTIRNCAFKNNASTAGGAGILARVESGNSSIDIENCVFDNNVSSYGSGIYFLLDRARTVNFDISNTLFSNNTSKDSDQTQGFTGSSVWLRTNSNQSVLNTTITNSTFANNIDIGNRADSEKGTVALSKVSGSAASAVHNANIYNSIIYGNTDVISNATPSINKGHETAANVSNVSNSISEDNFANATATTSVSNADPLFTDAPNSDFTLQAASPAIDAGDNSFALSFAQDLAGNARVHNTTVDQGAYEFGSTPPVFRMLTINDSDNGTIEVDIDPFENGYLDGTVLELTATPDAGFKIEEWGGDASGAVNPLSITMDANKTISATFVPLITDDNVIVDNNTVCFNESVSVTLEGSDIGARYYLRNSSNNSVVDGPIEGDGNPLVFNTGSLVNTSTFNVYGELIDDNTKNRQMFTEVTVTVEGGDLLLQYPISGNANEAIGEIANQDGTISGALFVEGIDGDPFGALSFDGSNDVVTLGDAPIGAGSFSVSLWVKVPTDGSESLNTIILSKREACTEGKMFDVSYRRSGDKVRFLGSARNNASAGSVVTGFDFPVDEWINLTYVKDNDTKTYRLIVNGVLEAEANWTLGTVDVENNAPIRLGATPCNGVDGTPRFKGLIDDVRIYDRIVEPNILLVEPRRGTAGAALDTVITISFNDVVDVSSLQATSITLSDANEVSYAYSTTFSSGDSVLTIIPDNPFPKGKMINVSVDTLTAANGCTTFLPFKTSFFTVFSQLVNHSPANGVSDVDSLQTISFKFDNTIDETTLENGIQVIGSHHGPVEGSFSMPTADSVVFTPSIPYFPNEMITVYMTSSLQDAGGGAIGNSKTFMFHVTSPQFANPTLSFELSKLSTGGISTTSPRILVPGDIDNDGDLDLIGGDDNARRLFFFENLGSGNYGAGQEIDSNNGYFDIKVTDFDFDGDMDIVTVDRSVSQGIYWHENDGSANFTQHLIVTLTNSDSRSIAVADYNRDGNLDVAVISYGSNRLSVFEADGNQLFAAANVGGPIYLETADRDNDGDMDLFLGNYTNGNVAVFSNSGIGTFSGSALHSVSQVRAVIPIDFDKDGDIDIAYSAQNANQIGILENTGSGYTNHQVGSVGGPHRIDVGDIDGDGDLDIIYTVASGASEMNFYYLENSGSFGLWVPKKLIDGETFGGSFTQTVKFADIDNDGDLDVLATDAASGFFIFENKIIDINNGPIAENPIPDQSMDEDSATGLTINVSNVFVDAEGDSFTLDVAVSDPGVTAVLNGTDLDITSAADFFGEVTITLTADDGNGVNNDVFVLDVLPVNDAPVFDLSTTSYTIDEDFTITGSITVTQNQPDNEDAPTYTISPASVSFADVSIDPTSGVVSINAVADGFGTQEFVVTANDGATENNTANQSFTLIVNAVNDAPIVANAISDVSFDEDPGSNQTINIANAFSDVDDTDLTLSHVILSGSDLATVTLANDVISIAAEADAFGTMQVEVTAEDAAGVTVSDQFDIVINAVNDAPTFTTSGDITLNKDFTGTETITVTPDEVAFGEEAQVVTYSLTPASVSFANVSIDSNTGNVSITAVASEFGTQEFTITADDGESANNTATQVFTLTILDNLAPEVINTIADTSMDEDQATLSVVDVTTLFSDPEGDALTYAVSDDFNGSVTSTLNGNTLEVTPAADFNGSGIVTVSASDANQTTSTSFTLTINAVNDAPTLNNAPENQEATEDVSYSFTLPTDVFTDVDGDIITITANVKPEWLSFDGGTFSGTPANADVGVEMIELEGSDGNGESAFVTFDLTIVNVNDAPVVVNTILDTSIDEDQPTLSMVDVTTLFNDIDEDALSYTTSDDFGGSVTVEINATNSFLEVTPAANYNGSGTITVSASDASETVSTSFVLTVNAVNDDPTVEVTLDAQHATQDVSFSYTLPTGLFADVDGDNVSISSGASPSWLSLNGDTFSGTPSNADVGSTTVEVVGSDGNGGSATATFSLTVANVNDAPTVIAPLADVVVDEDAATSTISLTGVFEDVDGDALSLTASTDDDALIALVVNGQTLEMSYTANSSGTATVTVTASDAFGVTVSDEFMVTVNSVNDAPVFDLSETTITLEQDFTLATSINILAGSIPADEANQTVTYSITSADADVVTTTLNGTAIELTAIAGAFGEQTFTVTADDGQPANNTHTMTFTVAVDRALSVGSLEDKLSIYPNPVTEYVMIDTQELVNVRFYSLNGQIIRTIDQVNGKIDVTDLAIGNYLMEVFTESESTTIRIYKAN